MIFGLEKKIFLQSALLPSSVLIRSARVDSHRDNRSNTDQSEAIIPEAEPVDTREIKLKGRENRPTRLRIRSRSIFPAPQIGFPFSSNSSRAREYLKIIIAPSLSFVKESTSIIRESTSFDRSRVKMADRVARKLEIIEHQYRY